MGPLCLVFDDQPGESMPRSGPVAGKMKKAPVGSPLKDCAIDGKDCFRDVRCRCRAAMLVSDDPQTITRSRQAEDRFQKIITVLPI